MRSVNDLDLVTVFSCIGHFTNILFMKVVPNRTSSTVISCMEEFMEKYNLDALNIVQSDNGKEFSSSEFETFVSGMGGKIVHGAPRHPQSQGVVERVHLTIKDIMHSLVSKHGGDVIINLSSAVSTYNTNYQSPIDDCPINALKKSRSCEKSIALNK